MPSVYKKRSIRDRKKVRGIDQRFWTLLFIFIQGCIHLRDSVAFDSHFIIMRERESRVCFFNSRWRTTLLYNLIVTNLSLSHTLCVCYRNLDPLIFVFTASSNLRHRSLSCVHRFLIFIYIYKTHIKFCSSFFKSYSTKGDWPFLKESVTGIIIRVNHRTFFLYI